MINFQTEQSVYTVDPALSTPKRINLSARNASNYASEIAGVSNAQIAVSCCSVEGSAKILGSNPIANEIYAALMNAGQCRDVRRITSRGVSDGALGSRSDVAHGRLGYSMATGRSARGEFVVIGSPGQNAAGGGLLYLLPASSF